MRGMTVERNNKTRELVECALRGDRAAFDSVCREYQARLLATIRRMLGRASRERIEPEDILQDAFATAWASRAEFVWQGPDSFLRWLEGIARHRALHLSRRELRRAQLLELHRPDEEQVSPSRGARRVERFERLKAAVDSLPPQYRDVLRLARLEGRSVREIAEDLGKTESAVKNLLLRAMKRLRDVMPDTESLTLPRDRRLAESAEEHDGQ